MYNISNVAPKFTSDISQSNTNTEITKMIREQFTYPFYQLLLVLYRSLFQL